VALMQEAANSFLESGTAQVVAQGVVSIGDGDYRWVVSDVVTTSQSTIDQARGGVGFVVVNSGVLLVENSTNGEQTRVAAGEAVLVQPGEQQTWMALGAEEASFRTIELISASTSPGSGTVAFESQPFVGTGARNDLDLVQDVIGPDESLVIPAGSIPTLVTIDAGLANVATEAGDVLSLGAGEAVSLPGALTITAGEGGATLSVAVVGSAGCTGPQGAPPPPTRGGIEIEQEIGRAAGRGRG